MHHGLKGYFAYSIFTLSLSDRIVPCLKFIAFLTGNQAIILRRKQKKMSSIDVEQDNARLKLIIFGAIAGIIILAFIILAGVYISNENLE